MNLKNSCFIAISLVFMVASQSMKAQAKPDIDVSKVFVHLHEWNWKDIATECEDFLGPNGYAAVQISPPQEHIVGPTWWVRYQPVSYKIESRNGTRTEFSNMVNRCKSVGVDIYADVLINHMAGIFTGKGFAGSDYEQYNYTVPYDSDDFHHCGRPNDSIADYQNLWEVQNCNLGTLVDLNTGKPSVQKKIVAYLNDLISLGVSGFRLDAAKHIDHDELAKIISQMDNKPYIFMEVIDRGGEPINAMDYLSIGDVTETKYPMLISNSFKNGNISSLNKLASLPGYLPSDNAVVFTDNHDLQRGHAGGNGHLHFADGKLYDLANIFMLSWPYGYPKVMSSYHFDNTDQGPPSSQPIKNGQCSSKWVCEHRRSSRTKMVKFRQDTAELKVNNWQAINDEVISFSRGNKGHVILNIGSKSLKAEVTTGLAAGDYCDILSSNKTDDKCNGTSYSVNNKGMMKLVIAPMSAIVLQDE